MGFDPLRAMDKVREHNGQSAINPYQIQGFGPDDPPAPELGPEEEALLNQMYNAADEAERSEGSGSDDGQASQPAPPSPLIPKGIKPVMPVPASPVMPDLTVMGSEAMVNQQYVKLDAQAEQEIKVSILRSGQRNLSAQLDEASKKPRQRASRSGVVEPEQPVPVKPPAPTPEPVSEPEKKKRGRPKGSRNKPKLVPEPEPPVDETQS